MISLVVAAVLVLLALTAVVYVKQRGPALEAVDGLPMTRLQKRAWGSLAIGLIFTAGIVAVIAARGFEACDTDPSTRLIVLGLFIGAVMAALLIDPFGLPQRDGSNASEERDVRALERAPRVQSVAMILTLAAWLTFLTLRFHNSKVVPMALLYLIFSSALIAYTLGLSLGVLLGYRRKDHRSVSQFDSPDIT